MLHRITLACVALTLSVPLLIAADTTTTTAPRLTANEIVEKNIAARGGLQAWRSVHAIKLSGKMEAGGDRRSTIPMPTPGAPTGASRRRGPEIAPQRLAEQAQLPFVMELKRPRKTRLELQFRGQTAVQVYDGSNGWKLRPFLNRHEVEPYTPEELKAASMQAELDGPLVDYAAKGTKVELEGAEKVEDRDTYKLKLTLKGGQVQHVWIDARTFLETKIEGVPRRLDGKYHPVATYFRDYRPVNGLQMAHLLETVVDGVNQTEKIEIEKVTVNPKLDDSLFAKLN